MPNEQLKEENIKKALKAGITCIYRDGVEGLQLNSVAAEAGLSKRSILRYFHSKENFINELLYEINGEDYQEAKGYFQNLVLEDDTAINKLRIFFETTKNVFCDRWDRLLVIFGAELYLKKANDRDAVAEQYRNTFGYCVSIVQQFIKMGNQDGTICNADGDNRVDADVLWNCFFGLLMQLALAISLGIYTEEYCKETIQQCIDKMINNLR